MHSFGGPAGQIAVIHRVVVDEHRWLDEQRFLHALSYCMLLPGPEAQQLVTYIGWRLHGTRGGLVAGLLFVLPGFLSILALSAIYAAYRDVGFLTAVFFGLKPAVLAIVFEALFRLKRRAASGRLATGIAVLAFVAIFAFGVPFPFIILGAAVAGLALARDRSSVPSAPSGSPPVPGIARLARTAGIWAFIWLAPVALIGLLLGPDHVFTTEAVFFSQSAVVTFGGAYAVLAYVARQAVEVYAWLTPHQMLDGLGLAETTPGPLIMVVQFVGFLGAYRNAGALDPVLAGVLGSVVTTWVTFAPCFLFIFAGAPYVERLTSNRRLQAALQGVTAAVVGVVANLSIWFALHTVFGEVRTVSWGPAAVPVPVWGTFSPQALAIGLLAAIAVFRFRAGVFTVLLGGVALGVMMRWV